MGKHVRRFSLFLLTLGVVLTVSCATAPRRGPVTEGKEASALLPRGEYEPALRREMNSMIARAPEADDLSEARLEKHDPYFVKTYTAYPDGENAYVLRFHETQSRTVPVMADARLAAVRYTTKPLRKRAEARASEDFLRQAGTETITWHLRNDQWVRVSSLFMVDETEELTNGQWAPVEPLEPEEFMPRDAPRRGWLGRFWNAITGR